MSSQSDQGGVTGDTVLEAQFDLEIIAYLRLYVSGILLITVVGIPLIPFWLIVSAWYGREFMRRQSARLTTQALEIRKGVFFRSESTIPLNRITDLRMHDGPLMRHYNVRGMKVETADSRELREARETCLACVAAAGFRDAVLRQRQKALDAEQSTDSPASAGRGGYRHPDGDPRHPGAHRGIKAIGPLSHPVIPSAGEDWEGGWERAQSIRLITSDQTWIA